MRFCPYCHEQVYDDSVRCLSCQRDLPKPERKIDLKNCSKCGKPVKNTVYIHKVEYCADCANDVVNSILVTTTNSIEGHRITEYIGIDSSEVVIGTGIWSEFTSDFQDIFGQRSTEFERKLQIAKCTTIQKIKLAAAQKGANAIVGMDLDYAEFTGNRIGVIASGTLVVID